MNYQLITENFTEDYAANVLKSRGVKDVTEFLHPTPDLLQAPDDLENIDAGAELISKICTLSAPKIALLVDADVDGFTSSAIMYLYLKELKPDAEITYFLHEAKQHGLSDMFNKIMETDIKFDLFIGPDACTNDYDFIEQLPMPALVLDHHLKEENIPISDNCVLINNQLSPKYRNKELSGAGVVWQFCRYLDKKFKVDYANKYIDLAALGVCVDMMSGLAPENQYIWRKGFSNVQNKFFQMLCLKQDFSIKSKVNPKTVGFYIGSLINAMVRVGSMEEKDRMFRAFINGEELVECHKRGAKGEMVAVAAESTRECSNAKNRQDATKERITDSLEIKIHKNGWLDNKILLVILDDDDNFPPTLNGLVCMELSSRYKRPTIIGRLNDKGIVSGSARGVNESELRDFKTFMSDSGLFTMTGGHANACGCAIPYDNIEKFHKYANDELRDIDFHNFYQVNFIRNCNDIDIGKICEDIYKYENCWSQNNDVPLIYIHDITIRGSEIQQLGKNNNTLKFTVNGVDYIKFFCKDLIEEMKQVDSLKINVIGEPTINEYMGNESPQILIKELEYIDNLVEF